MNKRIFGVCATVAVALACASCSGWSDEQADMLRTHYEQTKSTAVAESAAASDAVAGAKQIIASEVATPEEKAEAVTKRAEAEARLAAAQATLAESQAKLHALEELRAEAHKDDAAIATVSSTMGAIDSAVPGYGKLIAAVGGIGTSLWLAIARAKAGKKLREMQDTETALTQLSTGLNVAKANDETLAKAMDAATTVIGYFMDDRSRAIVDAVRKANNPPVKFGKS